MTAPEGNEGGPANTGTITATLFTQEQVNHIAAQEKRGAINSYFKELGFDKPPTGEELSTALTAAAEYAKLKNGEKGDVERLTSELAAKTAEADKVPGLEAALRRAQLAGDAGLKSRYHKYLEGETDDDITTSINDTLADVGGGGTGGGGEAPPEGAQPEAPARSGTGKLVSNPQQGSGAGGGKPRPSMSAGREAYMAKRGETKE